MTALPPPSEVKLGLVIDLDTCVGCHACVTACKGWNTQNYGAPLSDQDPYGDASGTFLNRIHSYQVQPQVPTLAQTIHFPKSCLHCEDAPCVTVCPTGASYKRAEDGIVLVNEDACMGCGLCAWACPYGARELDEAAGVMKKCTLCVDRIYNETLPEEDRVPACVRTCPAGARHFGDLGDPDSDVSQLVAARGGVDLMPEQGTRPVNKYLPPRPKDQLGTLDGDEDILAPFLAPVAEEPQGFLGWLDRTLEKLRCPCPKITPPRTWSGASPCRFRTRSGARRSRTTDMHPAPSVILFSVLSGAGFGLLAFLGVMSAPPTGWVAFVFFLIGYALALGGLFAAFFHLANKKNAVHSWTQWRTSWLSREAIAAVASLSVMGLYAILLIFFATHVAILGWLGAVLSLATVFTTSMIYTQLRSIPRWNQTLATPAVFLSYALASGALLSGQETYAALLMLGAGAVTLWHWSAGDKRFAEVGSTLQTATRLPGAQRTFEPPHTGDNYLTREMVFQIARKHAQKLRIMAVLGVAVIPAILLLVPLDLGVAAKHMLAGIALLVHLVGALVQRWLFFAEAEHVVGLYYGAHLDKQAA